ncbi:hypothetical protein BDZ89DRAFT_954690, partial [Hymenopellis radicata]
GRPQEFLEEFVRLEGKGAGGPCCMSCKDSQSFAVPREALYRCEDCWGTVRDCLPCTLRQHRRNPFHRIQRWNGLFYEKVTLRALGLRLQLGHDDGHPCVNPQPGPNDFTILHSNGIHKVNVDFCGCEHRVAHRLQMLRAEVFPVTTRHPKTGATLRLLEDFEMLSSSGKMSTYEHYNALVAMTDHTGVSVPKDRYKSYGRVNREFGHIKILKRGGRGCVENGRATTREGELALRCWACPRPGVNLPPNWRAVPLNERYLYRLIIALDANFRLCNLRRPSTLDPGLHTGWAYFVSNKAYLEHIAKYPKQKDISSCAGFRTLAHAETKNNIGLRSTGVGMCICARHEMVRPNGIGDLQRGERYCNMDFIALSGIKNCGLDEIFFSYDVVCQWCINFGTRMAALPASMQLGVGVRTFWGVPKCHCKGHKLACQVQYTMNVQPGVGRTDGEGIERTWGPLNGSAPSTKEMLPGGRHDTLDRRLASHNWSKNTGLGLSLHRKDHFAIIGAQRHTAAHEQFTAILPEGCAARWTTQVEAWEADRTRTNPYYLEVLPLAAEDRKEALTQDALHDTGPTVFISFIVIAEDLQRKITWMLEQDDKDTPSVLKEIHEKRTLLQTQIGQIRELQKVYMPCVTSKLASIGSRTGDVETEALVLPSDIAGNLRSRGCLCEVATKEEKLRESQCYDALETIRCMQRARRAIITFRRVNLRGQKQTSRAWTIIHRLQGKTELAARKYRCARAALLRLRGDGPWTKVFRDLLPGDIKALDSFVFDIDEDPEPPSKKKKSSMKPNEVQFGSGKHEISWIWLVEGATNSMDKSELEGSIRVEWLKSRARALRWTEESRLCGVEKQRTLLSLEDEASKWEARASAWPTASPEVAAGVHALAHRQAAVHRSIDAQFQAIWAKPYKSGKRRKPDRIEVQEVEESDSEDEEEDLGSLAAARAQVLLNDDAAVDDVD